MQRHQWRNRDEEEVILYRAEYHASRWRMAKQLKGEEEWEDCDPITVKQWKMLREILFNKYQRKRCPWELVVKIDKMLEELEKDD